jgi:hypothetical protein
MFIPDPTFFYPRSDLSIPDTGSASKNLSILTKKWFLSSRKYDPDCSSRIPDPGSRGKKAPDPGSGSTTLINQIKRGFKFYKVLKSE